MILPSKSSLKRVILAHWKGRSENTFEVFSNLLLFCKSYPSYSYNTLNNYLSKEKIAFENEAVRVERMSVLNRPIPISPEVLGVSEGFRMVRVARKSQLRTMDEKKEDLGYWLSRSAVERIAAATFLMSQSLKAGDRLDKTFVRKRKIKVHGTE